MRDDWYEKVEEERAKIDLTPWMHMTGDEIHHALGHAFFDKYDWAIEKDPNGNPSGRVTPKGSAYHDALMQLRDEKYTLEKVQRWMDELPDNKKYKYIHLKDKIVDIHVTPYVMADCGCCTESGGEHLVVFEDGSTIQFSSGGRLEPAADHGGFKWLRK